MFHKKRVSSLGYMLKEVLIDKILPSDVWHPVFSHTRARSLSAAVTEPNDAHMVHLPLTGLPAGLNGPENIQSGLI